MRECIVLKLIVGGGEVRCGGGDANDPASDWGSGMCRRCWSKGKALHPLVCIYLDLPSRSFFLASLHDHPPASPEVGI